MEHKIPTNYEREADGLDFGWKPCGRVDRSEAREEDRSICEGIRIDRLSRP